MLVSFAVGLLLIIIGFIMFFFEATAGFAIIVTLIGLFAIANAVSAIFVNRQSKK